MTKETFFTTKQEYTIGNIFQGVKYSYRITAIDSDNRIGVTSKTIEFIVDVPSVVDSLNCSVWYQPGEPCLHLQVTSQVQPLGEYHYQTYTYLDSIRPPVQGYIIYHNATVNGNTTSVFIPSNGSLLLFETEIPTECPTDWFKVSVAAVNILGKGEQVTSLVIADSNKPDYNDILVTMTTTSTLQTSDSYQYSTITNTLDNPSVLASVELDNTADMTDNAWTMLIISGAVGGLISLLILSLIITSCLCIFRLRNKECIPQGLTLQLQPPLSSQIQTLSLAPEGPIINDRRSVDGDYILPFPLGQNLSTNINSRMAYI